MLKLAICPMAAASSPTSVTFRYCRTGGDGNGYAGHGSLLSVESCTHVPSPIAYSVSREATSERPLIVFAVSKVIDTALVISGSTFVAPLFS